MLKRGRNGEFYNLIIFGVNFVGVFVKDEIKNRCHSNKFASIEVEIVFTFYGLAAYDSDNTV